MSVTIIKNPPLIAGSKNPVVYGLQTNNLSSFPGLEARILFKFTAFPTTNQYFDLSFLGETYRFTAVTAPDDSGLQYHSNIWGLSFDEYNEQVVRDLNRNYNLTKYYTITYSAATSLISIIAKDVGEVYNITMPAKTILSTNTTISGIDAIVNEFFSIYVQIYVNSDLIGEDSYSVDDDLKAYVDISEYIESQLTGNTFEWPEDPSVLSVNRSENMVEFYITYSEQYGNPIEKRRLTESSVRYGFLGGISDTLLQLYNQENESFFSQLSFNKQFLTNQPAEKWIRERQPEKLFFCVYDNQTSSVLYKTKVYYTDGTNTTTTIATTPANQGSVLEFIITPNKTGLPALDPAKTIQKFEVWLENQTGLIISETRTYYIETVPELYDRYFLFLNSLGGYDTLRTLGLGQKSISINKQGVVKDLDPEGTDLKDRSKKDIVLQLNKGYKVNTGYHKGRDAKKIQDYMTDFLLSEDVYVIWQNTIIPVVINTNKTPIYKDDNFLYELEFDFEIAFAGRCYSIDLDLLEALHGDWNNDWSNDFNIQ